MQIVENKKNKNQPTIMALNILVLLLLETPNDKFFNFL